MDASNLSRHRLINNLQSLLLLAFMALLCALLAWLIGGNTLAWLALIMVFLVYALNPVASPHLIISMYRGREISAAEAPRLYGVLRTLSERAGLRRMPALFYIPSRLMNAFAVGTRDQAAIAVSDGLLRRLDLREAAGVLGHEISHISNNDTRVMAFADLTSRVTGFLSLLGQFLLVVNLPLLLFSDYSIDWLPILVLIAAPSVSALVQLALSRNREYDADLGAAELTGDPGALASALGKMEHYQGRILERILFPGQRIPDPSLLRTHPPTEERIRRLADLRGSREFDRRAQRRLPTASTDPLSVVLVKRPARPRWHRTGYWF